ncbi:hypothetical protein [Glycomyces dulcitolivorans]|uniref:hypothetical protein n=1 Tax=Glycomyces dulcitolivorans TaxID=2200759 RepID=UPI0018E4F6BE|nr:hypothetical protein [Glycomyces dulcitolivorans]
MNDLRWNDVRGFFDPDLMGALPDLLVPGASVEDWQAVLDLVEERGWKHQYSERTEALPVPPAEVVLARPADAESAQLSVWLHAEVLAIFRFYSSDAIDFDVNLRELQGQDRLDLFCEFLSTIGRRLAKPVLMDAEGGDNAHPVLGYVVEHDRVVRLAEPFARCDRLPAIARLIAAGSGVVGRGFGGGASSGQRQRRGRGYERGGGSPPGDGGSRGL